MTTKKKNHPRSLFQKFSATSFVEVKEQANIWKKENPGVEILNTSTRPVTNNVVDGDKWFEIEIEYLE